MPGDFIGDVLNTVGKVASFVTAAPQGMPEQVWREISPWLTRFVSQAPAKWIPFLSAGFVCDVLTPSLHSETGWVGCDNHAVNLCDCCGRRVCLVHARIDSSGDVICLECVDAARRAALEHPRPPPGNDPRRPPRAGSHQERKKPDARAIAEARRVLGITARTSEAEARATYKKLLAKWHPDKYQVAAERERAEIQYKAVRAAFDLLFPEGKKA